MLRIFETQVFSLHEVYNEHEYLSCGVQSVKNSVEIGRTVEGFVDFEMPIYEK